MRPLITSISGSPTSGAGNIAADPQAPAQSVYVNGAGFDGGANFFVWGPDGVFTQDAPPAIQQLGETSFLAVVNVPVGGHVPYYAFVRNGDGSVSNLFTFIVD